MIFSGPDGKEILIPDKYVNEFLKVKDYLLEIMKTEDTNRARELWEKVIKIKNKIEILTGQEKKNPKQIAEEMKSSIPHLFHALTRHKLI